MIRLSVTDLESWRYWCADEDATLDQLLLRLRHQEPPTRQMDAGRAFARLMESAPVGDVDAWQVDGWSFRFALDAELSLPPVREVKAEVPFDTPSGPVTLVGKVDGLNGVVVHDQKLTERWDAERYLDSLQWRAYLAMFGASRFVYDVFTGRYADTDQIVTVTGYDRMHFDAYPGMLADVQRAVEAVAEIVTRHMPEVVA